MSRFEEIIAKNCSDCIESKTLGEICVKTENITWDNNQKQEFKYLDLTSVNRHTHFIEETESIDAHNAPSRAQKIVCAEDVIFGTTRPTLKRYCFIPNEYNDQICSTGYCVLRADRNVVLPRFIFHHMGSERFCMYVEANQKGSAYPAISDSDIRNFTIPSLLSPSNRRSSASWTPSPRWKRSWKNGNSSMSIIEIDY